MKSRIGVKLLLALFSFAVILTAVISVAASLELAQNIRDKYEFTGTALTETLARQIDGDRVTAFLETKQPDEYYEEILAEINALQKEFRVQYLYVALPDDDGMIYLWCNGFTADTALGYRTPFSPGGEDWVRAKMRGETEEPLREVRDPEFGWLATAAAPIRNSRGEIVALAMSDFSVREIRDDVKNMIIRIVIFLSACVLIFILVYFRYIRRNLLRPIKKLTRATEQMAENLEENVVYVSDIHTGDELETLSRSFEKMDKDLRGYIADNLRITAAAERMDTELQLAASIQSGQLPQTFPPFPDRREFDIYASMTPAKTVGGDFYDFFLVDDDHFAMVIADVSGKGIPASLFMMISRILIKNRMCDGDEPGEALAAVNNQLMVNNDAMQFVTVWLALVEISTGRGLAANAGHEHPALRRAGGDYELVVYRHSLPLGTMEGIPFRQHEFELHPGDSLFVYTDGVTEATSAEKKLFGTDRMLEALNSEKEAKPEKVLGNVMNGIHGFVREAEQFDDITMLCFQYHGPEKKDSGENNGSGEDQGSGEDKDPGEEKDSGKD